MLVCILTSAEKMADESVPKCIICPGFFKTVEHLQSRRHMLKAVEYDYMITPQISAIKSELRAELDKEKRDAREKAEQEQEAYRYQIVRENNMLYMQRQEQETGTSILKYCSCCDKQIKRKNWAAHEKTQGHIRMSMAKAVAEKEAREALELLQAEAQLITEIMNYEPQPEPKKETKYCFSCSKHITKKKWGKHTQTKKHNNNVAIMETHADSMNNLAVKVCPSCRASFLDWREHSKTNEHRLNEAEAGLLALSAE